MKICKLKECHIEPLRKLRNENREWFFNNQIVTAEQQKVWYDYIIVNKKTKFYIIEDKDRVIGALSLTKTKEGIEVGNIILDEDYRGKGIMTKAIGKLVKNKKHKFYARILLDNLSSQNLFSRCGFKKTAYVMELI